MNVLFLLLLCCLILKCGGVVPTATKTLSESMSLSESETISASLPTATASYSSSESFSKSSSESESSTESLSLPTQTVSFSLPTMTSTGSDSLSVSESLSMTVSLSLPTGTVTETSSDTVSASIPTQTISFSLPTGTATFTETSTDSLSLSLPTGTQSFSESQSLTVSLSLPTATATYTDSLTHTMSDSGSFSVSLSPSNSLSSSFTESLSFTVSLSLPTGTQSITITLSLPTQTVSMSLPTGTATATESFSRTITASIPTFTSTKTFSLTTTFSLSLPTRTETFSLTETFTNSLSESLTFEEIGPVITLEVYPPHVSYNKMKVYSTAGYTHRGPATKSDIIMILFGAPADNFYYEFTDFNCTSTYLFDANYLVKCPVFWFPTWYEWTQRLDYATLGMVAGWVYEGMLSTEYACAAIQCQNRPKISSVSGCFYGGISTFGCNPLSVPLLTVTGTQILKQYDYKLYLDIGYQFDYTHWSDSLTHCDMRGVYDITKQTDWLWINTTTENYYKKEKMIRCSPTLMFSDGLSAYKHHTYPIRLFGLDTPESNTGPNNTWNPRVISPSVNFAPVVVSVVPFPVFNNSNGTDGYCSSLSVTAYGGENSGLMCYQIKEIDLAITGWGFSQFCTRQACDPSVDFILRPEGTSSIARPMGTVLSYSDTYVVFRMTSVHTGGIGPFKVVVRSSTGKMSYSNSTVTIVNEPKITGFECGNSSDASLTINPYFDGNTLYPSNPWYPCRIPGIVTLKGDFFDPLDNTEITFIAPTTSTPGVRRDFSNITCDVVSVTSSEIVCKITETVSTDLIGSMSLAANYSIALESKFGGISSDVVIGFWSPPILDSVSGCPETHLTSTEHCSMEHQLVVSGKLIPADSQILIDGEPCLETLWLPPLYKSLLCSKSTFYPVDTATVRTVTVRVYGNMIIDGGLLASYDPTPRVLGIAGCNDILTNTTIRCVSNVEKQRQQPSYVPNSNMLIITGVGFSGYGQLAVRFGPHPCLRVRMLSDSVLTCNSWNIRRHEISLLDVVVERGTPSSHPVITEAHILFNPVPYITRITGCVDDVNGTHFCPPGSLALPLLIEGGGFQWDAPFKIYIGDALCATHTLISDSLALCTEYPDARGTQIVRVKVGNEMSPTTDTYLNRVQYQSFSCPFVNGFECNGKGVCDDASGTCICINQWDDSIACGNCKDGWWGTDCEFLCTCNEQQGVGMCVGGYNGTGICDRCPRDYFGPNCLPCPIPYDSGPVCAGHGVCSDGLNGTGICTCESDGWDSSLGCRTCIRSRFGITCQSTCAGTVQPTAAELLLPSLSTYLVTCKGNGRCSWGTNGTGTCSCDVAYGGLDCSIECTRGGPNNIWCYGRGSCISGVCQCDESQLTGYWMGDCNTCLTGWSGPNCDMKCPESGGNVCSNKGTCDLGVCQCNDGYCSTDCSELAQNCNSALCASSWSWGPNCEYRCPATDITTSSVCSGHGTCDNGKKGSGTCLCTGTYKGIDCSVDCSRCLGGTCNTLGECLCQTGWAGFWCSTQCPSDSILGYCSGHGRCDSGNTGSGLCQCYSGYAGTNCELECIGGAATPCNNNGICRQIDGGCDCHADAYSPMGSWDGVACSTCKEPWLLPFCNATCPGIINFMNPTIPISDPFVTPVPSSSTSIQICSGHGSCHEQTATCLCQRHETTGYYAGIGCEDCIKGYYGSECKSQCPGGACSPCSGHGICSDGSIGSGQCTCFLNQTHGMWIGSKCSECHSGWFGPECRTPCPGMTTDGVCSGRGICFDGRMGTGECLCRGSEPHQHYGGVDCSDCELGYFGETCTERCSYSIISEVILICSGNGICDGGPNGTGNCSCSNGYTGQLCDVICPETFAGVCGSRGTCFEAAPNVAACECDSSGHWDETSLCSVCEVGWWGTYCDKECPNGPTHPCSDRSVSGTCVPETGQCICVSGWGGEFCELPCPGREASPCSGHGNCNVNATCDCVKSSNAGFWDTFDCSACAADHTGPLCTVWCPTNEVGVACSGRGSCYLASDQNSRCICEKDYCGEVCELHGSVCQDFLCADGLFGDTCFEKCPGYSVSQSGVTVVCNNNGICDDRVQGNGECACTIGFRGADCSESCSRCTNGDCGNTLHKDGSASCNCYPGWAGRWCDVECSGGFRSPCAVNGITKGTCDEGSTGTGRCICFPGLRGELCQLQCPGGTSNTCNRHGSCQQLDPPCKCDHPWTGTECEYCTPGWSGVNCDVPCVWGTTSRKSCNCFWGYWGDGCSKECLGRKGNETSGEVTAELCSAHGECFDGEHGNGTCQCNEDWYGDKCDIHCAVSINCTQFRQHSVQCSATGCKCRSDDVLGHWDGEYCTTCAAGYWGEQCLTGCPCSDHAYSCSQSTGDCHCWDDSVLGHWALPNCDLCTSGFTGISCSTKQVAVTRIGGTAALFQLKFDNIKTSFQLVDDVEKRLIVCSTPPAVYSFVPKLHYDVQLSAGLSKWKGRILAASFSPSGEYVWVINTKGTAVEAVQVMRKALIVLQSFPLNPYAVISSGGVARQLQPLATLSEAATVGAAFIEDSICTVYAFKNYTTHELHVMVIDAAKGSLKLQRKVVLDQYINEIHDVRKWSSVQSNHIILLGVSNFKNVLIVATLLPDRISFLSVFGLGDSRKARMNLLALFGVRYAYTTIKEGTTLSLLRISIGKVVRDDGVTDITEVVLKEEVMLSTKPFFAQRLQVAEEVGLGQLVVSNDDVANNITKPSTLYKFDAETFQLSGNMLFTYYAGEPEAVVDIVSIPSLRISVALPATPFLRLIELNNFALTSLTPNYIDIAGGTYLTITGTGFIENDNQTFCKFLGRSIPAFNVTSTSIMCKSPKVYHIPQGSCAGFPVEASILGDSRWSENGLTLRLTSSATVTSVEPPFQREVSNTMTMLTLDGYGYVDSSDLKCKLSSDNGNTIGRAVYKSAMRVLCVFEVYQHIPSSATPYKITVSQDGSHFPDSKTSNGVFEVLGEPSGVVLINSQMGNSTSITPTTYLPDFTVFTTDRHGNILHKFSLDQTIRVLHIDHTLFCFNGTHLKELQLQGISYLSLQSSSILTNSNNRSLSNITFNSIGIQGGKTTLSGLFIKQPPVGSCTLSVYIEDTPWIANVTFKLIAGELQHLELTSPLTRTADYRVPRGYITHAYPDTLGPVVVRGFDGGYNWVKLEKKNILTCFVSIRNSTAVPRGSPAIAVQPNEFGTEWIVSLSIPNTTLLYGVEYDLVITLKGIESQRDGPIVRQPCGSTSTSKLFAVLDSHECRTCPVGGICDGTSQILVKEGYWRKNVEYNSDDMSPKTLRDYSSFFLCPNQDSCTGGNTADCATGHEGVLCQVCSKGFGLSADTCVECLNAEATGALAGLLLMLLTLMVMLLVYRTIKENILSKRNHTFVFIKLLIGYFQMLAVVAGDENVRWPHVLAMMLVVQRKVLTLHMTLAPFNCLAHLTIYEKYVLLMIVPLAWGAFLLLLHPVMGWSIVFWRRVRQKRLAAELTSDETPGEESQRYGSRRRKSTALELMKESVAWSGAKRSMSMSAADDLVKEKSRDEKFGGDDISDDGPAGDELNTFEAFAGSYRRETGDSLERTPTLSSSLQIDPDAGTETPTFLGSDLISPSADVLGDGRLPPLPPVPVNSKRKQTTSSDGETLKSSHLGLSISLSTDKINNINVDKKLEESSNSLTVPEDNFRSSRDSLDASLRSDKKITLSCSTDNLPTPGTPRSPGKILQSQSVDNFHKKGRVSTHTISSQERKKLAVSASTGLLGAKPNRDDKKRVVGFEASEEQSQQAIPEKGRQRSVVFTESLGEGIDGVPGGGRRRSRMGSDAEGGNRKRSLFDIGGMIATGGRVRRASRMMSMDCSVLKDGGIQSVGRRASSVGRTRGLRVGRALSRTGHMQLIIDTGDSDSEDELPYQELYEEHNPGFVTMATDWIKDQADIPTAGKNSGVGVPKKEKGNKMDLWKKLKRGSIRHETTSQDGSDCKTVGRFNFDPFASFLAGTTSDPICVWLSKAPTIGVRLTPINPMLSFVPKSMLFTPSCTSMDLSIMGKEEGEYLITWKVTASDAHQYEHPDPASVLLYGYVDLTSSDIIWTAFLIGFFIIHPMLVLFNGALIDCTEISGDYYLVADMSQECYTTTWWYWQLANLGGFLLYSVILPGALMSYMHKNKTRLTEPSFGVKFGFIVKGFTSSHWYWEFVQMYRKIILIVISLAVKRLAYRLFMFQVAIFLFFCANVGLKPFSREDLTLTESEGKHLSSDPLLWVVYICLVALNVVVLFSFVILFLNLYKQRLQEEGKHGAIDWLDEDGDGNITICEILIVLTRKAFGWLPCSCYSRLTDEEKEQKEIEMEQRLQDEEEAAKILKQMAEKKTLSARVRLGVEEGRVVPPDDSVSSGDEDCQTSPPEKGIHEMNAAPTIEVQLPVSQPKRPQPLRSPGSSELGNWVADHAGGPSIRPPAEEGEGMDPFGVNDLLAVGRRDSLELAVVLAREEWNTRDASDGILFDRAIDLGLADDLDTNKVHRRAPKAEVLGRSVTKRDSRRRSSAAPLSPGSPYLVNFVEPATENHQTGSRRSNVSFDMGN